MTFFFFFQAEDGIRDVERSRGLGDVYKRQLQKPAKKASGNLNLPLCKTTMTTDYIVLRHSSKNFINTVLLNLLHKEYHEKGLIILIGLHIRNHAQRPGYLSLSRY